MHDIDTVRMESESEGFSYEGDYEMEAPLNEGEEEMLAAELLGVTSEAELDQFFGKLFKRVSKGVGKFLGKNAGPLAGALKGIAKTALPTVGAALGTAIPIPGVGTAVGGMLGNAAASMLEAETESLNAEDQEFEKAKRFVRLAGGAAKSGARRPPTMNSRAAAVAAIKDAMRRMRAQQMARRRRGWGGGGQSQQQPFQQPTASSGGSTSVCPDDVSLGDDVGDLDSGEDSSTNEFEWESPAPPAGGRSGRWVRRGGKIVLLGI